MFKIQLAKLHFTKY